MGGGGGGIEETEGERAQAEVAVKRWADYQEVFKPYENKFMGDVNELNSAANYQRAEELAISPLAASFAEQGMKIQKRNMASGINPNSGKFKSINSEITSSQASAELDTASRANVTQQERYIGGLQNITAMGQGQATTAMNGMADIAQMSQRNARSEAQDALAKRNNVQSGVGAVVGAGTSYGLNRKTPVDNSTDEYKNIGID
jgi:hypothetical protein